MNDVAITGEVTKTESLTQQQDMSIGSSPPFDDRDPSQETDPQANEPSPSVPILGNDDASQSDIPSYQTSSEQQENNNRASGGRNGGAAKSFLEPFERFDHVGLLTEFDQDASNAALFEQGRLELRTKRTVLLLTLPIGARRSLDLQKRMLSLMLEFRVWSECRPRHENDVHGAKLLADLDVIENREIEQGQLLFFVARHVLCSGVCTIGFTESHRSPLLCQLENARQSLVTFLSSIRQALNALTRL